MTHTTPSLNELKAQGFYPDLIASIEGFMQHMHDQRQCALGKQIAEQYAAGYIGASDFEFVAARPNVSDPLFELKDGFINAMEEIFARFHDRLPRQFYATLVFLGTREDPTVEEQIPEIEHLLPDGMNWQIADSMLHALPLCSRLYFDVQSIINSHTGRILGHGCGCSCQMSEMTKCVVDARMGDKVEVIAEETESFLRHGLGQSFLLHFGLPQSMGPSVKMQQRDLARIGQTARGTVLRAAHAHV